MQESPLDSVREPGPDITPGNAWQHVWLYPNLVFHTALREFPRKNGILFFALSGLSVDFLLNGIAFIFWKYRLLSLVIAIAGSMLLAYLFSELLAWLLAQVGRALGGSSDSNHLRTVLTWAYVPAVAAAVLSLGDIVVLSKNLLVGDVPIESSIISIILPVSSIIQLLLGAYTVVLIVLGIKAVQPFGYLKATLSLIFSFLLIVLFLFILSIILS